MIYSDTQLSQMMDILTARVSALDGQGLSDPSLGTVSVLQSRANGFDLKLKQVVGSLEQQLGAIKTMMTSFTTAMRSVFAPPS